MSNPDRARLELAPAPRQKLAESVAQHLLAAVDQLPPGTALPSERELAQQLQVGRNTVREALNGLAMLGIVEIRHGQGAFVAQGSAIVDRDGFLQALQKGLTSDFVEARLVIEVSVASLAAQRRTTSDLAMIEEVLDVQERASAVSVHKAVRAGARFNVALATAAHNEVLLGIVRSFVRLMIDRAHALYSVEGFAEWDVRDQRHVFAAVAGGDAEEAGRRMRAHILAVRDFYRQVGV